MICLNFLGEIWQGPLKICLERKNVFKIGISFFVTLFLFAFIRRRGWNLFKNDSAQVDENKITGYHGKERDFICNENINQLILHCHGTYVYIISNVLACVSGFECTRPLRCINFQCQGK